MSANKQQLWIGSAHVRQLHRGGVLADADEAFVNVIASVVDRRDFHRQLEKEVADLDLKLVGVKDVEPLTVRLSKHSIHEDLTKLAEEVERTGQLSFDIFCTFDHGT
jgi:hypothetical protein